MAELKVGGEVDAWCTRCKMLLAHTTIAVWAGTIKRVRCNTCMGEHAYRAGQPGESKPSPRSSSGSATRPAKAAASPKAVEKVSVDSFAALMAGKDRSTARRYKISEKFAVGDLIEHPSFGVGVVAAARGIDKVDVAFPVGVKTLVHSKGSGPAFLARPPAPKAPEVEVDGGNGAGEPDPTAPTSDEEEA